MIGLLAAAGALRFVLRAGKITSEHIFAALSAYLLAGLFFGMTYWVLELAMPGSFAGPSDFTRESAIYFSFVTLATLGYGDFLPKTDMMRGLVVFEVIGGQLFLAVMIARLVGLSPEGAKVPNSDGLERRRAACLVPRHVSPSSTPDRPFRNHRGNGQFRRCRRPKRKSPRSRASVDAARMKATVEKLVSFGTRHTLSSQTDPKRGIGAAVRWAEAEMKKLGLETLQTCDTVTKLPRIPTPTKVCNAVAIQRGTERPNDVVIITGHIDSRVTDPMNATADAPGANDDGSGTAAVMEAARVLSKHKFPGTIVYAALSGEEQGLLGGKILADYAKAQGWNVIANLNNDIVGNSCSSDGVCNDKQVRIFSEGPALAGRRRASRPGAQPRRRE